MPWTETTRREYERRSARYASDMTDREWALIAGFLPPARCLGRPRKTSLREVVNALLYIASSGCAWRLLPKEFPPFSTVQKYFYRWRDEGLLERISHSLVALAREASGRDAQPTAGVLDSQSVKTTESGGVCGYDGAKKIKGRKRHILTDTNGFLLAALVHAADIQDRDGAPAVLGHARFRFPWMRHVFADGGYTGQQLRRALTKIGDWKLDIIKRTNHTKRLSHSAAPLGRRTHLRLARKIAPPRQGLGANHRKQPRLALHRPHQNLDAKARKAMIRKRSL